MKRFLLLLALTVAAILAGCGGGGGGPTPGQSTRLSGRVLSVVTGGALSPAPSVQTSGARVTAAADGSFLVGARAGTTSISVDTATFGVFVFTIPAAVTGGTTDTGDLYVGPERVTVTGTVRDPAGTPLAGASVRIAGRSAVTGADGRFILTEVAYSSASPAGFLGLVGSVTRAGSIAAEFGANGNLPSGAALDVGVITLTPTSDPNPPGTPFTIFGFVQPAANASGTVVSLTNANGVVIRRTTVGSDGRYGFFVGPGTYAVSAANGARTAGPFSVTLATSTDVVRRDVDLP